VGSFYIKFITKFDLVGSFLIGVSVILGYIVEKAFKYILGYVKNWQNLLSLLFILYLTAGISLFYLHRDALTLVEVSI
jgi:hypothetical protein